MTNFQHRDSAPFVPPSTWKDWTFEMEQNNEGTGFSDSGLFPLPFLGFQKPLTGLNITDSYRGSEFNDWCSPMDGILIMEDATRDKHTCPSNVHWSHVAWHHWLKASQHFLGPYVPPPPIDFVISSMVINDITKAVCNRILRERNWTLFCVGDEEFYALLATPNVSGTLRLCIENKDALGGRIIRSIVVKRLECPDIIIRLENYA